MSPARLQRSAPLASFDPPALSPTKQPSQPESVGCSSRTTTGRTTVPPDVLSDPASASLQQHTAPLEPSRSSQAPLRGSHLLAVGSPASVLTGRVVDAERGLQDAPDAMNLFHSNKSKARALAAAQAAPTSSSPTPSSSRRGPALPRLFGGGKSIPHSPASYALHTPPVLLPPQAADSVPRWSPSPPQKQYESDGQSSASGHMLSSGTDDVEDSDEDEWTGVELAEDEHHLPGGAFLRQNVNFGELLDSSDQPISEHDDDESEILEITTRFAGPTSPTSQSSSKAGSRKSASSHRRVSRSASGTGTPVLEDEPAAWWTSSGSLASLANGSEDERADGQPPAIEVRPSKVGLAVDYDNSAPDEIDAERLDVTVRGRGRSTSPSLSSYTPGRPSSRTSPPTSPDPNEFDLAVSPFPSHAGSSATSEERDASTPLPLDDDTKRTPSKTLPAHVRPYSPTSPSLPPIPISPTSDAPLDSLAALSAEQEAMALALHVRLAEASRAPLLPRSSSRGAVERDDAESSASSIYSRSSGVASPNGDTSDTPSRRSRMPSAPSADEQTLRTAASIPSFPTVVAPSPPLQTQPRADLQSADAPVPLVSAVPERRREAKPERKAPILKQKSLHRKPGAGQRVISGSNPSVPSVGEEPSSRATTPAELESASADQYADASRSSSHSSIRLRFAFTQSHRLDLPLTHSVFHRERTPLSASDFAEVYGAFSHSPSAYDAELPETHREPPIPIMIDTVSSPPLPPIPHDGSVPDQFLTPELDEAAQFSTPLSTPLNTSFGSRLQANPAFDMHRRSECFSEISDDYHDAAMSRTSSTDAPVPAPLTLVTDPIKLSLAAPIATDLAPTPSPTSSKGDGVSPTTASRGDAKARALAFVADLKRAKMAAASQNPTPSTSPLPSPVAVQGAFVTTPRAAELPLPPVDSDAPAVSPKTPPTIAVPLAPEPSPPKTPLSHDQGRLSGVRGR